MIAVLDKLQQTLPAILEQAVTAGMKPAAASAYKELNAATKEKQALDIAQAGKMGIDTTQFSSLSSAFDSASAAQNKVDTLVQSKAKQARMSVDDFMASDAGKEYQKSDEYKNAENARKAAEQNFATTAQSMGLSPDVAEEISAYRNTTAYTQAEAKIKQKEEAFKAAQAGPPPATPPRTTPQEMPIAPDANAARQQAKAEQDARSINLAGAAVSAAGTAGAIGLSKVPATFRKLRERFFGTKPGTPTPAATTGGATGSVVAPDMATGSAGGGAGPSKVATPKVKAPVKSRFKMPKIKGRGKAALLAAGAAGLGYLFGGGGGEETTGGEQAGAATATAGGAENALALAEAMINIQNATINIGTATIGGSPVPATAQQAQTDAAVQAAEQEMVAEEGNPFVEAAALGGNLIAGTGSYALAEKAVASASKPVVTAADDALAAGAKTTASESVETAAKNAVAAAAKTGAVEATEAVAKTGLIQTAKSTVQTIAKSKGVLGPKGSVAGTAALVGADVLVGAMGGEDAVFRETYDTGRDVAGAGIVAAGGGVGIAINTVADGLYTGYELITDTNNKLAEWNDSSELDEFNTKIQAYGNGVGHLVGAVDAAAAGFTRPIDTFGNALTTAGSTLNQVISNIQQQGKIQSQEESAKTNQLVYDEKTGTVNKQAMSQSDPLYGLSRSEQLFARREATLKTQLATATQVQGGGGGVADYAKLIGASEADYANTDMAKVIETINAELASLEKQKVSERTAGNLLPNSLTGAGQDTAQYDKAVTSLMADQARDTAVVAEMAKQATQPGSIFTHDTGTQSLLEKLLAASPTGSLAGGAGQLAGVAQSLNANIGSGMTTLLNKLPTGGGDILKTGYEAVGKLLDPKALSENMAGAGSGLLSSLINPTETLQSLLSTKKTDLGVGSNPFMMGGSLASALATKNDIITPAATDSQSNLLSQILAVLKECCSALNTKAMTPTAASGTIPPAIPAPPAPGTPQALTTPVPVAAVAPATPQRALATPSTTGLVPMPELALNKVAEQEATKPQITAKKAEESVKLETDQQKVIDASRKAKQKEIDKLQKRVNISKRNLKFSTDPTKDSKIQENISKNEAALASAKEDLSMIDQYEKDELQKVAKTKEIEAKLRNPLGTPTTTPLATPAAAYTSGVINASSLGSTLQQAYAANAQVSSEASMMQYHGLTGPTPTTQRMADQFRSSMAPANATQQAVDWNDPALAGWTQDANRRRNGSVNSMVPIPQPVSTPLQQNPAVQQSNQTTPTGMPTTISLDPASITAFADIQKSFSAFGTYVSDLAKIKLPYQIEIVGNSQHTVEVNITGASALQALDDRIKGLGVSLIADKLNALETKLNKTFPDSFKAPGSGGKGSSQSTTAANQ